MTECLDKLVPIEGVKNARELGGYRTTDGKMVRCGLLFRSGRLENITETGIRTLRGKNVTCVLDFRTDFEYDKHPDPAIDGIAFHRIRIIDETRGEVAEAVRMMKTGKGMMPSLVEAFAEGFRMDDIYVEFLDFDFSRKGMAEALRRIIELPEGEAVLWHCNGGKDRTGTLAVLLLLLLGVDEKTALDDFEFTNELLKDRIAQLHAEMSLLTQDEEVLRQIDCMSGVSREYMERAIAYITAHFGTAEQYAKEALGFTQEEIGRLRTKYLTAQEIQE